MLKPEYRAQLEGWAKSLSAAEAVLAEVDGQATQITDLQGANTEEVGRRRNAESRAFDLGEALAKLHQYGREMVDACVNDSDCCPICGQPVIQHTFGCPVSVLEGELDRARELLAGRDPQPPCDYRKPHGLVFFREAGKDPEGSRIMAVTGVLQIDDSEIEGECQYGVTDVRVHKGSKVDRAQVSRGLGFGDLLKEPIWRT